MAPRSKKNSKDLRNVQFNIKAQEGKQQLAMDLMPTVMIYGGAAGCVDHKTEYLSPKGWKYISDYDGGDVAQFNPKNRKLSFCQPYYVNEDNKEHGFYKIENSEGVDQCNTIPHRFIFYKKKKSKKHFEITVGDLLALQQVGKPLRGYVETLKGKRVGFNIQGKPSTYLKIYKHFPEDSNKYCFETETGFLYLRRNNHYFVTGNSGKSRLMLLKALKYAYKDPKFFGIMFRRTTGELRNGGLYDDAVQLYQPLNPHIKDQPMEILFKSTGGGRLKFSHLEHERDKFQHQGKQYTFFGMDELCLFEESQFMYLISRLRSESEINSFTLSTCNPDPDSWVKKWVRKYLDEDEYPIPEMCGKILYYVIVNGDPEFYETEEEIRSTHPDLCSYEDRDTGETIDLPLSTFTFIGGTVLDNPALLRINPEYLSNLKNRTEAERASLLYGCWKKIDTGESYFSRNWLNKIRYSDLPNGIKYVRAWDKAIAIPREDYKHPDYTASIKMGKDTNGNIYILGDFDYDAHDEGSNIIGKFRRLPGERDQLIENQAHIDGVDVTVVLPRDPSGAGVIEYMESAKKLISKGFFVKPDAMPSNKSKMTRFLPFSSACQNGFVYIVEESFPNNESLEAFYKELELYTGKRSTATVKDD